MGTIKKLYQDQLVGGSGSAGQEVYPVTSTLGVYDDQNNQLQGVLDKVTTNLGLFTCGTAAATAAKTVSASKFVLMEGGSVKIKFTYANSADSPTLAIGSTAAKPIMFNGSAASASNSWGAGEIVEFFYDGTNWVGNSTSVSVSQNIETGKEELKIGNNVKWILDNEPEACSDNLVKSGGVIENFLSCLKTDINVLICDSDKELYATISGYIDNNGAFISTGDAYKCTDYVDISNAKSLIVKARFDEASLNGIQFFDKDKNYISGINKNPLVEGNSTLTLNADDFPEGAYYCRVNFYNYNVGWGSYSCDVVEKSLEARFNLSSDEISQIKKMYIKDSEIASDEVTNYALYVDIIDDYYYIDGVLTWNDLFQSTTIAKLDKENDVYIYCRGGSNSAVFFDKDKNYISQIDGTFNNTTPLSHNSFPSNAEYIAFSFSKSSLLSDRFATRNSYIPQMGWKIYPTFKKKKGERPTITIKTTDSENEILVKLVEAYIVKDCDVTFEYGQYTFEDVYTDMVDVYEVGEVQGSWQRELPLGGNCTYNLGSSTITGTLPSGVTDGKIFGSMRSGGQSYKLFNGTLISTNMIYCIHDDGQASVGEYIHDYSELILKGGAVSVFGFGSGIASTVKIHNCVFINDSNIASIAGHGITDSSITIASKSLIEIVNCWLSTSANIAAKGTYEDGIFIVAGCSVTSLYDSSNWDKYFWNNEIRQ